MKPTSLTSRMLASQPMGRTKEDGRKPYFMRNELLWLVLHRIIEAICGGSIKMGSLLCSMARPLMQPPVKNSSMGPMGCAAMTCEIKIKIKSGRSGQASSPASACGQTVSSQACGFISREMEGKQIQLCAVDTLSNSESLSLIECSNVLKKHCSGLKGAGKKELANNQQLTPQVVALVCSFCGPKAAGIDDASLGG
eukprot:1146288-Pelagomonas_calceolata.AAC.7